MIAKTTLMLVGCVLFFALFLALFLNAINTSQDAGNTFRVNQNDVQQDTAKVLDNRHENLFHFVQISDTHFSRFNDYNRSNDLKAFCRDTLPVIAPPVLVLTGDITDSRTLDPMGSLQFKEEWDKYNQTRLSCLADNPSVKWLDIRGNHDNFNVFGEKDAYYKNYTVQGHMTKDARSYRYEYAASDGNRYSFIGVDACFHPGIRRPFNFIGKVEEEELKKIQDLKAKSANTNYTVWFGHYPTSSITNAGKLRSLINGPYLCGHYHNFHGMTPQMWSTLPEGYFEVELGDWKTSRFFRINVIDGGLYSFSDFNFKRDTIEGPMIVVTNPRSVLFQMESYEKFWRTKRSTHIRAAVFSSSPVKNVWACIATKKDDASNGKCQEKILMQAVQSPLFVGEWSPEKYLHGLFHIAVFAENDHSQKSQVVPFSLDRSKPHYSVLGRFSIRVSFENFGLIVYFTTTFLILLLLISVRVLTTADKSNFVHYSNLARHSFIRRQLFRVYLLVHINTFFYSFVIFPVYIAFGPWMYARLVHDEVGVVFIWKSYVDGYFLPAAFSYLYAALFLYLFHIPMIFVLGTILQKTLCEQFRKLKDSTGASSKFSLLQIILYLYIALLMVLTMLYSSMYMFAYGTMAVLTSVFTWSTLLYVILIYRARNPSLDVQRKWL